jgi:hypothetical protein
LSTHWTIHDIEKLQKADKKVKLPHTSANALTKHALKILDLKGFKVWRQNNGGVYDPTKKVFRANSSTPGISSLLSDEAIKLKAKEMTTFPKMCYPNTMMEIQCGAKYEEGAKWSRDSLITEIERRQKMIISEPDGIVRETMINDLLVGLQ